MEERTTFSRRRLLARAAGLAASLWVGAWSRTAYAKGAVPVVEVVATLSADGHLAYFDPVGLWVAPGTVVRWRVEQGVHTVTAYHPNNRNHEWRIPSEAQPWDSGYLTEEAGRNTYEYRFALPGVYDYFCLPHEFAGMVGRIVVGEPGDGPGTRPFGWGGAQWQPVPEAAQRVFPPVVTVMEQKVVRFPGR